MSRTRKCLKTVWNFVKKNYRILILLFLLFLIFFSNTFHQEYPDEYDSIVGGMFINQGKVPYRDWFQHHQPGAYVLASLILPFSGRSFVRFRILLAVAFFLINVGGYLLIKRRLKNVKLAYYLVFLFVTAFAGTYFWGHMLLADTLAAYLFIPGFAFLLTKEAYQKKLNVKDLIFISSSTFLTWFTSMSYIHIVVGVNLYAFYRYIIGQKEELRKRLIQALMIFLIPYLAFFSFFIVTGSFKEYYFANVTYNVRYYIYNYPRPSGALINPLRYSVVIFNSFINNYFPILTGVSAFSLGDPFNVTLAVSIASLFLWLLIKKRYPFLLMFAIVVVFSTARSNPWTIKEADYQASMYILIAFISGFFTIFILKDDLDSGRLTLSQKIIEGLIFVVLGIYWVFNGYFIPMKFVQKMFPKYMGTASLIYDRPEVAPIINKLTTEEDYAWVGPFDFKELFYIQAKIPSKYHWFLDHAGKIDKIKTEMISDFTKNRPKIIVFRRYFHPWGGKASDFNYFFTDFLDQEYFRIFEYNQTLPDKEYKWKIGNTEHFDINGDFYFDKRRKDEIINELLSFGLIEAVPKSKITPS